MFKKISLSLILVLFSVLIPLSVSAKSYAEYLPGNTVLQVVINFDNLSLLPIDSFLGEIWETLEADQSILLDEELKNSINGILNHGSVQLAIVEEKEEIVPYIGLTSTEEEYDFIKDYFSKCFFPVS